MVSSSKAPCDRCGWKWGGSHVCVNLSEPDMKKVGPTTTARVRKKAESDDRTSNQHLRDAQFKERNKNIIRLYSVEQKSMREIAKAMDLPDTTVMNVLHAAKERGEISIRKTARRTTIR